MGAQNATVRRVHRCDAAVVDLDPVYLVREQNVAAGLGRDAVDQGVDQMGIVLPRIESAAAVLGHQRRVKQEGNLRGGEEIVSALARQDRADTRGKFEFVEESGQRPVAHLDQSREPEGRGEDVAETNRVGQLRELAREGAYDVKVSMERARLVGEESDEVVAVGLPPARNAVALSGDDDMVVAVRVEFDEGHPLDQVQVFE